MVGYSQQVFASEIKVGEKAFPMGVKNHLQVELRQYDSFGNTNKYERVNSKKLIGIRMQVHKINSEF